MKLTNKPLRFKEFKEGYLDGEKPVLEMSWEGVGNTCAEQGMSLEDATSWFIKEWNRMIDDRTKEDPERVYH